MPAYACFRESQKRGFTVGIIYSPEEVMSDPHFVARGFPVEVEHPELGRSVQYPGAPWIFHGSPWQLHSRAPRVALENARINGLEDRVLLFTGTLAALRVRPFDLVVANLLRSELLPMLEPIAHATRPGGAAIFSGLLAEECEQVEPALESVGLPCVARRHHTDPSGLRWAGLLSHRRPARSSDRTSG